MRPLLCLVPLCLCLGCTSFPELDAALGPQARRAETPQLVPLGPVLAQVEADVTIDQSVPLSLEARAAALRARAARLRGASLSASERARLRAAGRRNAERLEGG